MKSKNVLKFLFFMFVFLLALNSCNHDNKLKKDNDQKNDKPSQTENNLRLLSFKIQGSEQAIKDEMIDCGKVKSERLKVEAQAWPYDAQITFEPELQTGDFWALGQENGKKELAIVLKSADKTRRYTARIEKIGESSLSISSITVGDERKEEEDIVSSLQFTDIEKGIVEVRVTPSASDAQIAFQGGAFGNEKTYEWALFVGENILKIALKKDNEEVDYTVHLFTLARPLATNFYLNGMLVSNIKDGFYEKAQKGGNPLFDAGCNALNMQFTIIGKLEALIINGNEQSIKKDQSTNRIFLQEMLNESEKEFEIKIIPQKEAMERQGMMRLTFKAKGNNKKVHPAPRLIINGDDGITPDFLKRAENENEKPLYKVFKCPAEIKIDMTGYEYNVLVKEVLINGEKIEFNSSGSHNYGKKEIAVTSNQATPVEVQFVPFHPNVTESFKWTFAVQAGGEKPALQNVKFYAINDEGYIGIGGELPESFENHLRDGSNPLYEFDGKDATVIVGSTLKDIIKNAIFKMDGNELATVEAKEEGYNVLCTYTFHVADDNSHQIEIVVNPVDENEWSPLKYSFKLKKSGKKAPLPSKSVLYLQFNGVDKDTLPSEIKDHLEDGSLPLLQIVGKNVDASFSFTNKHFKKIAKAVSFKLDNNEEKVIDFNEVQTQTGKLNVSKYAFPLPDITHSHVLKMQVIPKDEEHYMRRTFSLCIKSKDKADMPLIFGVNLKQVKDKEKITVNSEKMTLVVQSPFDVMGKVKIGIKGEDLKECEIKQRKAVGTGRVFWEARCDIVLVENNVVAEKTISAIVEPKDLEQYKQTNLEFFATGTSGFNNAEFEQLGKYGAKVKAENEWKTGCESKYMDDYGAIATRLTFYTVHPRANVKYAIVGEDGLIADSSVKNATNKGDGSHTSERITFFDNKPTRVKAWVIAEDGVTEDGKKGVYYFDANSVLVNYRYTAPTGAQGQLEMKDFTHEGASVIRLNENDIQADKTIHLIFGILTDKDTEPFIIVEDDVKEGQTNFKKAKKDLKAGRQCYVTSVNIEKLLEDEANGGVKEIPIKCHIKKTEGAVSCFTYELKLRLN